MDEARAGSPAATSITTDSLNNHNHRKEIHSLYQSMDLEEKGLSLKAFEYACKGYYKLLQKNIIQKEGYLTICDFSQSVKQKRLYLVDMANEEVVLTTYVAHGKNSGGEYATWFSNKPSSLQSSLGFYVTNKTYSGGHGLSLRIVGLEAGYNDKALRRNIVIHGADYIGEGISGRSFGCPALPKKESAQIIQKIKDGSCLFIYHPSKQYLNGSKILND